MLYGKEVFKKQPNPAEHTGLPLCQYNPGFQSLPLLHGFVVLSSRNSLREFIERISCVILFIPAQRSETWHIKKPAVSIDEEILKDIDCLSKTTNTPRSRLFEQGAILLERKTQLCCAN